MKTLQEIQEAVAAGKTNFSSSDVPIEVYHDRACPGVSNSRLGLVRRSPAHFNAWIENEAEEKESDALDFGAAMHTLILEPQLFPNKYVRLPDKMKNDPRTHEFKNWYSNHEGKEVMKANDWESVHGIRDSLMRDPEIAQYLQPAMPKKIEHSIWWLDTDSGLICKARLDIWVLDQIILDPKSTTNASPYKFSKTIDDFRYHAQAAMQVDAVTATEEKKTEHYLYLAIEKTKPYVTQCYRLKKPDLELGRAIYKADLQRIRQCTTAKRWPGYFTGIQDIGVPEYAHQRGIL